MLVIGTMSMLNYQDTKELAKELYQKDDFYVLYSEHIFDLLKDEDFAFMYSNTGRPAVSPALLGHCLIIASIKNLTDREIAEMVKSHIGVKYALHLPLNYKGFHFDDLSAFRQRLLDHNQGRLFLDKVLQKLSQMKLINPARQRTDSTWMLSRGRKMKRYETVGYALREASKEILQALEGEESEITQMAEEYNTKYNRIRGTYKENEQKMDERLTKTLQDAISLLNKINNKQDLVNLEKVKLLAQIIKEQTECIPQKNNSDSTQNSSSNLSQQLNQETNSEDNKSRTCNVDNGIQLKNTKDLKDAIVNPFDPDMRCGKRSSRKWVGVNAYISETIPEKKGIPSFITNVVTTPANVSDQTAYDLILESRNPEYKPEEEITDSAFISAENVAKAKEAGINLIGVLNIPSKDVFAIEDFTIDEERRKAICPAGKESSRYSEYIDNTNGYKVKEYKFKRSDCTYCFLKEQCTKSPQRSLHVNQYFEVTKQLRKQSQDPEFVKQIQKRRSPIESTIREFTYKRRKSRWFGLAILSLMNEIMAASINIKRFLKFIAKRNTMKVKRVKK